MYGQRLVARPMYLRKGRLKRQAEKKNKQRMARAAAKADTRAQMATPAAQVATRARKAARAIDGRVVPEEWDATEATDVAMRCRSGGLVGGAPKTGDFAKMKKMDLMAAAKAMGVDTRRRGGEGKKTTWRPMPDVVDDCERALAGSSHGGSGVGVANAHAGADGGVDGGDPGHA